MGLSPEALWEEQGSGSAEHLLLLSASVRHMERSALIAIAIAIYSPDAVTVRTEARAIASCFSHPKNAAPSELA